MENNEMINNQAIEKMASGKTGVKWTAGEIAGAVGLGIATLATGGACGYFLGRYVGKRKQKHELKEALLAGQAPQPQQIPAQAVPQTPAPAQQEPVQPAQQPVETTQQTQQ